jgi:hypothetical protein
MNRSDEKDLVFQLYLVLSSAYLNAESGTHPQLSLTPGQSLQDESRLADAVLKPSTVQAVCRSGVTGDAAQIR